jgi:hypothetical protein
MKRKRPLRRMVTATTSDVKAAAKVLGICEYRLQRLVDLEQGGGQLENWHYLSDETAFLIAETIWSDRKFVMITPDRGPSVYVPLEDFQKAAEEWIILDGYLTCGCS